MSSLFRSFAVFSLVLAAASSPPSVRAQSLADLNEAYVDTVLAIGTFTSASQDVAVYTVPAKRRLRLTDVIMTNTSGGVCDYRIFVGNGETNEFTVQPRSTLKLEFNTGLLFVGPTNVTIRNTPRFGGVTPCGLVTITGLLTRERRN